MIISKKNLIIYIYNNMQYHSFQKYKKMFIVFGLQPNFNLIVSLHDDYWP